MQTDLHFFRWAVGLSNGETYYEYKSKLPSWKDLLNYIEQNNLTITSLLLYTVDGRRYILPSNGKRPKFAPFQQEEKPLRYSMRRYLAGEMNMGGQSVGNDVKKAEHYTVIEAEYESYKLQLWADEINKVSVWTVVEQK
jgi:hypothetical protein